MYFSPHSCQRSNSIISKLIGASLFWKNLIFPLIPFRKHSGSRTSGASFQSKNETTKDAIFFWGGGGFKFEFSILKMENFKILVFLLCFLQLMGSQKTVELHHKQILFVSQCCFVVKNIVSGTVDSVSTISPLFILSHYHHSSKFL